jgi:Calcineurin-like phosphoesterase
MMVKGHHDHDQQQQRCLAAASTEEVEIDDNDDRHEQQEEVDEEEELFLDENDETRLPTRHDDDGDDDGDAIQRRRRLRFSLMLKLLLVWLNAAAIILGAVQLLDPHGNNNHNSNKPVMLHFHRRDASPASMTWNDFVVNGNHNDNGNHQVSPSSSLSTHQSHETFQIMQITDLHLGEAEDTEWGPQQDYKTWKLLDKMLTKWEQHPDLIVLGGDQLTANNCLANCTEYYQLLGKFLSRHGIPWATVLGNHDDMAYEDDGGDGERLPHTYHRRDLLTIDQAFPLSLTQTGPDDVTGASNYVLQVLDSSQNSESPPALEIYFLDSGGGTLSEAIDRSQVQWLQQQLAKNEHVPAVAFQHIPTSGHVYNNHQNDDDDQQPNICVGYHGDGVNQIQDDDSGLVDLLIDSGRFHFLAVGHNHGNDYCCHHDHRHDDDDDDDDDNDKNNNKNKIMTSFCFGRHSGYGGYGNWQRGVRMYEIQIRRRNDNDNVQPTTTKTTTTKTTTCWRSWVRQKKCRSPFYLSHTSSCLCL